MRLQDYLTESMNLAFFISPKGEIIGTPQTHIQQVIANPEKFGFWDGLIDFIYDTYKEPKGLEGKAREQILISLLNQGWIRLRRSKNFWTAQLKKLDTRSKKHISQWAAALLGGKLGTTEMDPYIEIKIIDINGKMSSSGLQQLKAMSENVDISDVRLYEISELDDLPLIEEYQQLVNELFDLKVEDFKITKRQSHHFQTEWRVIGDMTANLDKAMMTSDPKWSDKPSAYKYMFQAYRDEDYNDKDQWVVDFARDVGYNDYDTKSDMMQAEVQQVFSGVKKSFMLWVKQYNPTLFWFDADDQGHLKVYKMFAKLIKSKMGYGYQLEGGATGVRFHFWKLRDFVPPGDPNQLKLPGF